MKVEDLTLMLEDFPPRARVYVGDPATPLLKILSDQADGKDIVVLNPSVHPQFDLPAEDT